MNITRAVKISLAWTTIAWTVCYLAFGLIPGLTPGAVPIIFHMNVMNVSMQDIFTIDNFIIGLIVWNVIVAAGVALAGLLGKIIKD